VAAPNSPTGGKRATLLTVDDPSNRRGNGMLGRAWKWLAISLGVALVGALGAWATFVILGPVDDPLEKQPFTYATVVEGEIEASLSLNTTAQWTPSPVGVNQASGVVTAIEVTAGDEVHQGQALFTVDLRPVVAAVGEVPAFRSIQQGTEGEDVAQLQQMLAAAGFYAGPLDGEAGVGTVSAIRGWQKSLGIQPTGVVEFGDVIFVPQLPSRIALDTEIIKRGNTLRGGEDAVQGLPRAPDFSVAATDAHAAMMPTGTRVEITSPEGDLWEATVTDQERDQQSQTTVVALAGVEDSVICGEQCGQVPVTGQSLLSSRIVTVEPVSGLVVPSAALVTAADGTIEVIDDADIRIPVKVVASARGMSVVEGVAAGSLVRLPPEVAG